MSEFREFNGTTDFVSRFSMLLAADRQEEIDGTPSPLTELIRLDERVLAGDSLTFLEKVRRETLQSELQLRPIWTARIQEPGTIGWNNRHAVELSERFGNRYLKIKMPVGAYNLPETNRLWDDNPIEKAEILFGRNLPLLYTIRTARLSRTPEVIFRNLDDVPLSSCVTWLLELGPAMSAHTLRLPKLPHLNILQVLRRTWKNLQNVDCLKP